jgi:hypothetical protein
MPALPCRDGALESCVAWLEVDAVSNLPTVDDVLKIRLYRTGEDREQATEAVIKAAREAVAHKKFLPQVMTFGVALVAHHLDRIAASLAALDALDAQPTSGGGRGE